MKIVIIKHLYTLCICKHFVVVIEYEKLLTENKIATF